MLWLFYWIYWLVLIVVVGAAGLLLAAFTLPGTWLILGDAAVYALLTGGRYLSWGTLLTLFVLALVGEIVEFAAGGAGAKKAGANKWGIAGGLLGAILGGIFLSGVLPIAFPLSTIVGICLGSFIGAFSVEMMLGQDTWKSIKIGFGAAKGRFLGMLGKFTVAMIMFLITVVVALPRHNPKPKAGTAATSQPTTLPATRASRPTR